MNTTWLRFLQITVPAQEAAAAIAEHRETLEAWRREGRLIASWPLAEHGGFVDVFRADDLVEATALAESSPLIAGGLCAWTLRAVAGEEED